jgi:LysM repeat protein
MYRKTIEIENELSKHAARYGIDPLTARAVVIQESGGNAHLVSRAGARGYFQVMPGTFRSLRVRSNIEAGIKYLAQLKRQFGREDYAIATYNAGPGAVGKDRPLRLETLQYVIAVGHYKSVLRLYEPEISRQAKALRLRRVRKGDSWETLARETSIPAPLLRLYNPFLATRPLQSGAFVSHPLSVPTNLLEYEEGDIYYTSRIGDSYLTLAYVFGVHPETFRNDNDLWRLQQLPVGIRLRVSVSPDSPFRSLQLVSAAKPTQQVVARLQQTSSPERKPPAQRTEKHRVRRGETLGKIAQRYRTTVRALMQANGLRSSRIQAGTSLLIPSE